MSFRIQETHIQEHISSTNYKCQICHQIMSHETVLQFHVNRHAYNNVYPSEVNKIIEQKVQYYKCEVCNQSFSEKINLKIHLDKNHSHLQETAGCKCQVCDKSFKRKYNLEMHLLKHPSHKVQASNSHQPSGIIEIDGDDDDQNQNNNSKTIETHTIIDDDIQENDTHVSTIPESCVEIQSKENQTNGNWTNDSQNKILASRLNNGENEVENMSISNILYENENVSSLKEPINKKYRKYLEKPCEDTVHITEKPVVTSKELIPEISNNNEESLEHEINTEEIRDVENNGENIQEVENNEEQIEKINNIDEEISAIENNVEKTLEK